MDELNNKGYPHMLAVSNIAQMMHIVIVKSNVRPTSAELFSAHDACMYSIGQ